jgi:uncharacterized protein (TIGR00255 family)
VDVSVAVEDPTSPAALPDARRVRAYVEAWRGIAREIGLEGDVDVATLAGLPNLFLSGRPDGAAERARGPVERALALALDAFERSRAAEGEGIAGDMRARLARMNELAASIAARAGEVRARCGARLLERVQSLLGELGSEVRVSPGDLEREVAIQAARSDVSEELQRIGSHLAQFEAALAEGSPAGRKLDFLVQEIHREISTLGAKVADCAAAGEAIEFRSELEKVREQVQNVE